MYPRIGIGVPSFRSAGGGTPPAPSLLLDTYSGAAAAYSFRKLRTDYSGPAITLKVIDGGANPEHQIFFDGNGELDTTQIQQVCGPFEGVVAQWWDQSGNDRHASQTNILSMPKIYQVVEGIGTFILVNGKPSIQFDGTNDNLLLASSIVLSAGQQVSSFHVEKKFSASSVGIWMTGGGTASPYTPVNYGETIYMNTQINESTSNYRGNNVSVTGNPQRLISGFIKSVDANSQVFINNTQITLSLTGSESRANGFDRIGSRSGEFSKTDGQELIIYLSDQSSNRTNIESNINSFYSIF